MKKTLLFFFLLVFFGFTSLKASHTTAAQVTYEVIDPATNLYEITLKVYMKCGNITNPGGCPSYGTCGDVTTPCGAPGLIYLYIKSSCSGCEQVIFSDADAQVSEVSPYCDGIQTTCNGGNAEGYQEWIFKHQVTLPPCADWEFAYPNYARSASITNIVDPADNGTTVFATLDNTQGVDNSSPDFTNQPLPFGCINGKFCFNNGAVESDGDSISYRFIQPLNEAQTNIQYQAPYNFTSQLSSASPITIDPITGDVCMEPDRLEVTVVAVQVVEWRDGRIIGTTMRDIQLTVVDCNREPPFPDPDGSTSNTEGGIDKEFNVDACDGLEVCVTIPIESNGTDALGNPVNIDVSWLDQLPVGPNGPATYNVVNNNTPNPDLEVCWTPPSDAKTTNPHSFQIIMKDDGCPITTFNNQTVLINIAPCPIKAEITPNDTICPGECVDLSVFNETGGIPPYRYEWSDPSFGDNSGTFSVCPSQTTTYSCRIYDDFGSPDTTIFYTVVVNPPAEASIAGNTTICFDDTTQLFGSGGVDYTWLPNINISNNRIANPLFFPKTDQEYTLSIIDQNGCEDDVTVQFTVNPLPIFNLDPYNEICEGDPLTLSANGPNVQKFEWEPAELFNYTGNGFSASVTSDTSFTLTLIAFTAEGCTAELESDVVINPLPDVNAGPDLTMCEGTPTNLLAEGASTYSWEPAADLSNPNSANPAANPAATTDYTVTGIDDKGCVNSDVMNLKVFPTDFAQAGPDVEICLSEQTLLKATPNGAEDYFWAPKTLLNNQVSQNVLMNGNRVGTFTYTLTVTLDNGCQDTDELTVTVFPNPNISISPDPAEICLGDNITLNASGGTSYSWEPSEGGVSGQSSANYTVSPEEETEYSVTGTDGNGCSTTASQIVIVNGIPDAPLEDQEICANETAILNATTTGGITYSWMPINGLNNPLSAAPEASPNTSTIYTVNIIDNNGCITNLDVAVIVNPLPTVDAGPDFSICNRESRLIQTTSSGPSLSYDWSPRTDLNNFRNPNPTITPTNPGNINYTLTVTDGNRCINSDVVNVTVFQLPTITFSNPNPGACSYEEIQVTALGANSYSWQPSDGLDDPNASTVTMSSDDDQFYIVTGTDTRGCVGLGNIRYTAYPDAIVNHVPDDEICIGDAYQFNPDFEFAFEWKPANLMDDPNSRNPISSPTTSTVYTMTAITDQGCMDSMEIDLTVNLLPIIDAGKDTVMCVFDTIQIGGFPTASPNGTSQSFTYDWSPDSTISNTVLANPNISPTSPITFTLEVIDNNNCISTDSIDITVYDLPNVNAGPDVSICPEDNTVLVGSGIGSNGSYFWSPPTGLLDRNSTATVADPSQTTEYTLRVTDTNTCKNFDTVLVTVFQSPIANAGPDREMCIGDVITLNGNGGIQYDWKPTNVLNDSSLQNPDVFPGIDTEFTLIVTDNNGCIDSSQTFVTVHPLPIINFTQADTSICKNSSVQLGATGGTQYSWEPALVLNNSLIQRPTATIISPTTFTVTVVDANLCENTASMSVDFYPDVSPFPNGIPFICPEDTTTLNASNGEFGYQWEPNYGIVSGANQSEVIVTPDETTEYTVSIVDQYTCPQSATFLLSVFPKAEAFIEVDNQSLSGLPVFNRRTVIKGETVKVFGMGGDKYEWFPPNFFNNSFNQNPLFSPDTNMVISLAIIDENGCVDTTEYDISVIRKSFLYVPTAFTPNGDGENDVFKLVSRNNFELKSFSIFNRWGQKVWETNNLEEAWDGTFKGEPLKTAVFMYQVIGKGNIDPEIVKQGSVTLIR